MAYRHAAHAHRPHGCRWRVLRRGGPVAPSPVLATKRARTRCPTGKRDEAPGSRGGWLSREQAPSPKPRGRGHGGPTRRASSPRRRRESVSLTREWARWSIDVARTAARRLSRSWARQRVTALEIPRARLAEMCAPAWSLTAIRSMMSNVARGLLRCRVSGHAQVDPTWSSDFVEEACTFLGRHSHPTPVRWRVPRSIGMWGSRVPCECGWGRALGSVRSHHFRLVDAQNVAGRL